MAARQEAAIARRPVRERHVIVETDEVDVGVSPKLIEMWPLTVRDGEGRTCALVLPSHPIGPIRRVGDKIVEIDSILGETRRVEHTSDIVRKRDHSGDERVIPNCVATSVSRAGNCPPRTAYCFQAAKLRTNKK